MLSRYKMRRGKAPADDPLPDGVRADTRKHTKHFLRPSGEIVDAYLKTPDDKAWKTFRKEYLALITGRFKADSTPFDELAEQARTEDVYLGCSCPTDKNPDARHCHTMLALEFMAKRYPDLEVVVPGAGKS